MGFTESTHGSAWRDDRYSRQANDKGKGPGRDAPRPPIPSAAKSPGKGEETFVETRHGHAVFRSSDKGKGKGKAKGHDWGADSVPAKGFLTESRYEPYEDDEKWSGKDMGKGKFGKKKGKEKYEDRELTSRFLLSGLPMGIDEETVENYFAVFGDVEEVTVRQLDEARV